MLTRERETSPYIVFYSNLYSHLLSWCCFRALHVDLVSFHRQSGAKGTNKLHVSGVSNVKFSLFAHEEMLAGVRASQWPPAYPNLILLSGQCLIPTAASSVSVNSCCCITFPQFSKVPFNISRQFVRSATTIQNSTATISNMLFVAKHVVKTVRCPIGKMTCWCSWPLQEAFFINPIWEIPLLTHALYTTIQRTHAHAIIEGEGSELVRDSCSQHLRIQYFDQRHLSAQKISQHHSCNKHTFQFHIPGSHLSRLPSELVASILYFLFFFSPGGQSGMFHLQQWRRSKISPNGCHPNRQPMSTGEENSLQHHKLNYLDAFFPHTNRFL